MNDADLDALGLVSSTHIRLPRAPKKPRRDNPEHRLHVAAKKYLTVAIAPPGELSRHNVCWYSVGHEAVMSMFQGGMRKARGVIRGLPDIDLYYANQPYKIELKAEQGYLSADQKFLHANLRAAGVHVEVCYSLDEIIAQLAAWRIPVSTR